MNLVKPFPKDLLMIDVETGGVDENTHPVIQLSAVLLDRSTLAEKESFTRDVFPFKGCAWDRGTERIHGITWDMAHTRETGVPPETAVRDFTRFTIRKDWMFCGWNVGFDVRFLRQMYWRTEYRSLPDFFDYHLIDVYPIACAMFAIGSLTHAPRGMHYVADKLGLKRASAAHDALEDCRLTAGILRFMVGGS